MTVIDRCDRKPRKPGDLLRTSRAGSEQAARVQSAADLLANKIRHSVQRRTNGGIRDLAVEVAEKSVRLRGHCSSFYSKQLAQHAAMDVAGDLGLTNEIQVA